MSSLERTWSSASSRSGVTPLTGDTWPAEGVGGCRGTGQGELAVAAAGGRSEQPAPT